MLLLKFIFISFVIHQVVSKELNNRPIIGILAQHVHRSDFPFPGDSYIIASYVKYLEMAGARVVPIKINLDEEELHKIFSSINGVLFPGGDSYVLDSPYQRSAEFAFDYAINEAMNGNHFPIWGTCLGMQQLSVLAAKTDTILSHSAGTWDTSLPLEMLPDAEESRLFTGMTSNIFNILKTQDVTYNAHYNCVSTESYNENKNLNEFFKPVTVNKDANGKQFISTMEARDFPMYATQWHPEVNPSEFAFPELVHINHSIEAVLVTQYFANFFVSEARKNFNKFKSRSEEMDYLMYNYSPVYSAKALLHFEQMYIF